MISPLISKTTLWSLTSNAASSNFGAVSTMYEKKAAIDRTTIIPSIKIAVTSRFQKRLLIF